jgi:hypothetical protein
MKKHHIFLFIVILTGLLSLMVWRSKAQTAKTESNEPLDRYTSLILSLQKSGQTNTANEVAGVISAMDLSKNEAGAGILVAVLHQLRSGHTNEAINLLETQLNGALIGMAYSEPKDRSASFQDILRMANDYRKKYPRDEKNPDVKAGIQHAFSQLQK